MKIIPKENYVQIRPYEEKKKGSIIVPEQKVATLNVGEVVSLPFDDEDVKEGDTVYFKKRPVAMMEDKTIIIPKEHLLMKVYEE